MYLENQLAAIGGIQFGSVTPDGVKIDTACINETGMYINPEFYAKLNETEKKFLVEHELLHLILKHHSRFDCNLLTNKAADLAINSILQKRFCGDKNPVDIIPTMYAVGCFPSKEGMPEGQTADWYIQALKGKGNNYFRSPMLTSYCGSPLDKKLSKLEKMMDGVLTGDSSLDTQVKEYKKKERYSFTGLVQSLVAGKSFRNDFGYVERMGRDRKFDTLLPATVLGEGDLRVKKDKVLLFLDFSDSCRFMVNDFLNAANQIPNRLFEVVKFKFATKVVPFESNRHGSGTSFENVRLEVLKYSSYDMVWVFTDGKSSFYRKPVDPQKWHWFLDGSNEISAIPKGSNIHFLKNLKRNK